MAFGLAILALEHQRACGRRLAGQCPPDPGRMRVEDDRLLGQEGEEGIAEATFRGEPYEGEFGGAIPDFGIG